jgi:hypothetical protein
VQSGSENSKSAITAKIQLTPAQATPPMSLAISLLARGLERKQQQQQQRQRQQQPAAAAIKNTCCSKRAEKGLQC